MTNTIAMTTGRTRADPLQSARDNHTRRMDAIGTDYEPRIEDAEADLANASDDVDQIAAEERRGPSYCRNALLYWAFMIFLAICEAPLNRLSYELFFNESPLLSIGIALLVGSVLVSLAHSTGGVARRFRHTSRRPWGIWSALLQLTLTISLIGMLCYGVAVLRQGYLAFLTRPDPALSALIENDQIGQAATHVVLATALAVEGWIFLAVNLAIVAVGVLASFYAHDPHPDYEAVDRAKRKAEALLKKLRAKRAHEQATEKRRFANQLKRLGA